MLSKLKASMQRKRKTQECARELKTSDCFRERLQQSANLTIATIQHFVYTLTYRCAMHYKTTTATLSENINDITLT